jgi:hypothetical protein
MRHVAPIVFSACLLLTGCLGADADARVLEAFGSNPQAAVLKYREVWNAYDLANVSDERMLIASEMMAWDTNRYEDYYRFVIAHVRKEDGAYRSSALRALRNARGVESLGILFDAYESGQRTAANEALFSIRNRYEYAKGLEELKDERRYIEKRVEKLQRRGSDLGKAL